MRKRMLGFIGWVAVLVLVGLVFQYTPQASKNVQPVQAENVSLKSVEVPTWFGQADMVGAGFMPMARPVACYRRHVERAVSFTHSIYNSNFRAVPRVRYKWCHNLRGRDWAKAYQITLTMLYERKQCKHADGETSLRGFKSKFYFKDGFRKSKSFVRGMWLYCHKNGFSSRTRDLGPRATRRQYNVKHIPPYAIAKTTADFTVVRNAVGRKRLPMTWYSVGTPL